MSLRVPLPARRLLDPIAKDARKVGVPLYVVGGAVRDWLLGKPAFDLDLVVEGDPKPLAQRTARRLGLKAASFEKFGTVRLGAHGRLRLDFAAARRELYAQPAALPSVEWPAPIVEDLRRRDFTINALAYRLSPGPREIVDPYGGAADLERGVVRVLHEDSLRDDPTRVFRAARYAARFSFAPAPGLAAAASRALDAGWAAKLSRHRLAQEFMRVLGERHPAAALKMLDGWGYLSLVSPVLSGVARWPAWDGLSAEERLAAIALTLSRKDARALLGSLPLERARIDWIEPLAAAVDERRSPKASPGPRAAAVAKAARLTLPPQALKARFLTGADLQELGRAPGPGFRELLDEAAGLQWRGKLAGRRAALLWLKRRPAAGPA